MHLLRDFEVFFISFILILLGSYFLHPITNLVGDLGYYLKIGQIITTTHSIPSTNLFSYTYPNFPFINSNWLAEVVFFFLYKFNGGNSLILLSIVLSISSFGILIKNVFKKYNFLAIAISSLLYIQIVYERTDIKPELFSYLLLSCFIAILYKYKRRPTKLIYSLLPLQVLWTNLHIFFFLGPVVLFLFLVDETIARKGKFNSKKINTLALVTLFSIFTSLINPNFIKGALYPFLVMQNYGFKVEENSGFLTAINSYSDTTYIFFEISITLLWVGILFTWNKLKPIDIALSILFTFFGFFAVRTFPLFAIGTFIPLVKVNSAIVEYLEIKQKRFNKPTILKLEIGISILLLLLIIPSIKQNINIHGFGFGIVDNAHDSVEFIKKNKISGPIFNNYDIGNYLDFSLYPQEKVFVDGRPEAYPKSFFEKVYFPMQQYQKTFDMVDSNYKFNAIVLAHTDTSPSDEKNLNNIINSPYWKMVYLNNTVVIFVKNNEKNKNLIEKYSIDQYKLVLSSRDLNSKNSVRQLVNFFRNVGWEKQWLAMNLRYLNFEPTNCPALQNIAFIYQKQKSQMAPIYISKYLNNCR